MAVTDHADRASYPFVPEPAATQLKARLWQYDLLAGRAEKLRDDAADMGQLVQALTLGETLTSTWRTLHEFAEGVGAVLGGVPAYDVIRSVDRRWPK